jgi:DNA ligase (NAD+)
MNWKELGIKSETEVIQHLKNCGFDTVPTYECTDASEIEKVMDSYRKSKREKLDWDIDGLVIKTNTIKDDDWALPTRSVAYKFEAESAVTKLIDVIWQDSGGRINPVGILEPVTIGGITVGRATLNNIEFIKNMKVKIGDLVVVSRRNDVIPCIEGVSVADPSGKVIVPPSKDDAGYPIVHATNSQGEQLVYLISTNPNSKAKKVRQIMKWYEAHDTKGVAEETISLILEAGIATDLPSFFKIGLDGHIDLAGLDGFGSGKFRILNKATKMTQDTELIKFFDAIDLPGFGISRFETILEHANKDMDVQTFFDYCSDCKNIANISGFGINTAESLANALNDKKNLVAQMLKLVKVSPWKPIKVDASSKINGKSFCFTGSMSYDRSDLEKAAKKKGGLVSGVSKHLDFLVTNDVNSGSSKNVKADKLGIKKISEQQFLDMIGGKP